MNPESMNRHDREELDWLAFCYVANELSDDERAAFEQRLVDDAEVGEAVARAVQTIDMIQKCDASGPTVNLPHRQPTPRQPPRRRTVTGLWVFGLASAVCVALLAMLWHFSSDRKPSDDDSPFVVDAVELDDDIRLASIGFADFRVRGPRHVQLEEGELFVEGSFERGAILVETPAGTATINAGACYVSTASSKGVKEVISGSVVDPSFQLERGDEEMKRTRRGSMLTRVLVVAGMVALANAYGDVNGEPGELLTAEEGSAPERQVENLNARFGRYYAPVTVDVEPAIPAYHLPLTADNVANWDHVVQQLHISEAAQAKLRENGFVVMPLPHLIDPETRDAVANNDIVAPYAGLQVADVPVFVTTDTLLHLFHVQFDETLKDIEEREFYGDMVAMSRALETRLAGDYAFATGNEADVVTASAANQAALRKAWTFVSVAMKCLDPEWDVPQQIDADVAEVLDFMEAHEGFERLELFQYKDDMSQYVPRGHYTRSENLKRYFKAMMWYGRMTFILKGGEPYGPGDMPFLVSAEEGLAQTMAGAHLTSMLGELALEDGRKARDVWERIYTVTAFYVGLADDLGLPEYEAALEEVLGASYNVAALSQGDNWEQLQLELARFGAPAIYSGTGEQSTRRGTDPEKLLEALDKSTGFRVMGQRFIPDSYIMGRLVFPTVGNWTGNGELPFTAVQSQAGIIRGFPRGLDVMSVMGSERARQLVTELGDDDYGTQDRGQDLRYDVVLDDLREEFDRMTPGQWNQNIYWSWLYSLKPLTEEFQAGYPTFMTNEAWQNKSLNTALASWAQIRHDTILYAKQSNTPHVFGGAGGPRRHPVQGYVEPVADFYARLLSTIRMTQQGLEEMDVTDGPARERLAKLDTLTEQLLNIVVKELGHQELTEEEYTFIRNFGDALQGIRVSNPELESQLAEAREAQDWDRWRAINEELNGDKSMMTTLVADVHTDQNSGQVLEEGTGHVDLIVVCYLQPDGRLVLGAGPVLSYYEFRHPMDDRLTDEAWVEMLESGGAPERPEWTETYFAE